MAMKRFSSIHAEPWRPDEKELAALFDAAPPAHLDLTDPQSIEAYLDGTCELADFTHFGSRGRAEARSIIRMTSGETIELTYTVQIT